MARAWYVLHIYSGYEKKIEDAINGLIAENSMQGVLFQVKIPTREITGIKNGKKKNPAAKFSGVCPGRNGSG